jgi:hypothetical protein
MIILSILVYLCRKFNINIMKGLRIGNLSIAVPVFQGGMGVGISLSGLASAIIGKLP